MRRLLSLFLALAIAAPSYAQDDGTYPEPAPEPYGYGTFIFQNWTAFDADFLVNGVTACRAYANSSCTTQTAPGRHYLTGRLVTDPPRETSETIDLEDGATVTWEIKGGGTPPVPGAATPQLTGYGTIEIKNYSAFQLDAYADGAYLCRAEPSSSCSEEVRVGTHYVTVRTVEATPRESPATSVEVVDGGTSSVEFSGGGNAPTGYGTIEVTNGTNFQVDAYVDGSYLCRAYAASSCSGQATVGTHTVSIRTIEDRPREATSTGVEVVDGGTTTVSFEGGGDAPTGYGAIEFVNGTAFSVDFYVDRGLACRAEPRCTCTAQVAVGDHSVTSRTVEETPRESEATTVEVVDGGTTRYEIGGGGEPVVATGRGTIMFDNQSTYTIDFYIDGSAACRAAAVSSCSAEAAPGARKVTGRTVGEPSYEVSGVVDVTDGAVVQYAVADAAGAAAAPPPPPPAPSRPAPPAAGRVEFQNLTEGTVEFYIDGGLLCQAGPAASCEGLVPPGGGRKVTVRTVPRVTP